MYLKLLLVMLLFVSISLSSSAATAIIRFKVWCSVDTLNHWVLWRITAALVDKLIEWTIETGMVTSSLLYVKMRDNYYLSFRKNVTTPSQSFGFRSLSSEQEPQFPSHSPSNARGGDTVIDGIGSLGAEVLSRGIGQARLSLQP
ncbi:hypothetical protein C8F04DRAFT_1357013 [Mycena alexandri]|uniref:Uncharacterized protein n=1 Tax=Mycena alexandri TaxID=1745969 RepID=A0AAD6SRK4_9AGAR|nr:hypothetical protein C8F04DRAFT_1357013 [Mycena alexandri]